MTQCPVCRVAIGSAVHRSARFLCLLVLTRERQRNIQVRLYGVQGTEACPICLAAQTLDFRMRPWRVSGVEDFGRSGQRGRLCARALRAHLLQGVRRRVAGPGLRPQISKGVVASRLYMADDFEGRALFLAAAPCCPYPGPAQNVCFLIGNSDL